MRLAYGLAFDEHNCLGKGTRGTTFIVIGPLWGSMRVVFDLGSFLG